jgi:ubiquinone/menaquinone biosynthesis C-methylase UbiE
VKTLLRFFFRLLYHQFAFTYDLVAATVSFNRWKNWVQSVIPFIEGDRILEMGHGPGHLQRILRSRGLLAVGIDESAEMGRLAKRNLARAGYSQIQTASSRPSRKPAQLDIAYTKVDLIRGIAQALPFPDEAFDTIVATFPTEYITESATLTEVKRCLVKGGRLVVLPVALPKNPFLDWLFRVTHQSPVEALDIVKSNLKQPFVTAGFTTEIKTLDQKSGILLVVLATDQSSEQLRA